jgi:hypothetical protein
MLESADEGRFSPRRPVREGNLVKVLIDGKEALPAIARSARRLIYLENQFLWSPEILIDKLCNPPDDDFRVVLARVRRRETGAALRRAPEAARG